MNIINGEIYMNREMNCRICLQRRISTGSYDDVMLIILLFILI